MYNVDVISEIEKGRQECEQRFHMHESNISHSRTEPNIDDFDENVQNFLIENKVLAEFMLENDILDEEIITILMFLSCLSVGVDSFVNNLQEFDFITYRQAEYITEYFKSQLPKKENLTTQRHNEGEILNVF